MRGCPAVGAREPILIARNPECGKGWQVYDLPMRAILLENFGAVESLNVREVQMPAPGTGEVLVEIRAAAINPSDVKNVQGKMHGTTLPRVPGKFIFTAEVAEERRGN